MKLQVKKVIAREGLVFLAFAVCLSAAFAIAETNFDLSFNLLLIVLYGYPLYFAVRFVMWAIRILRKEEQKPASRSSVVIKPFM